MTAALMERIAERRPLAPASDPPSNEGPPPSAIASRIVIVDASWLDVAPPPREYLARDMRTGRGALEARGAYILGAAGGVGKGFATIALAVAVVTETPWLGCLAIERAGRVLIVSAEEPADELRRRIYHVARAARIESITHGALEVIDLHDVHAPLLDADGHTTENAEALVELVRTRGPYALVVLDPLARLAGAPIDKDNVAAGALMSVHEAISSAAQGLVLGVHHTSLAARRTGDSPEDCRPGDRTTSSPRGQPQ